ncbi:MAG TPA: hypothetical protein VLG11_00225 [Candidatus Saccharimonadales bacterium]|nr:hypothetical protein [Candidatus Saccharimonadales bacterium]
MLRVFLFSLLRLVLAVLTLALLVRKDYWAGLAALLVTQLATYFSRKVAERSARKNAADVLRSITDNAVSFIIIVSFGYAHIVHWVLVLPLLFTTYLVGYMGLRIGIATNTKAPPATKLEKISLPVGQDLCLLVAALFPSATFAGQGLANGIFFCLLLIFAGLVLYTARYAYTHLLVAKS